MRHSRPTDFVELKEVDPTLVIEPRYSGSQNFLGKPAVGYKAAKIFCTQRAADHLKQAHEWFKKQGYRLVVYDGYRPQRAVEGFRNWGEDLNEVSMKEIYYPTHEKKDLFKFGYIAGHTSSHTRGSTFDLTLIKEGATLHPLVLSKRTLTNGEEVPFLDDGTLDMGSSFDLFHEVSHHDSSLVTEVQNQRRSLLRQGMKRFGFSEIKEEWWHYTLTDEPYSETSFDFEIV